MDPQCGESRQWHRCGSGDCSHPRKVNCSDASYRERQGTVFMETLEWKWQNLPLTWSIMARVAFCVWDTYEGIQASSRPGSTYQHSSQDLGTHHLSFLDFLYISLLPSSFFSFPSGARGKWLLAVPNHMSWFSNPSSVFSSLQYEGINFQKVPALLHFLSDNTIPFPCRNRVSWQTRMCHVCRRKWQVNIAVASQRRRCRNSNELPCSRIKCSSWAGKTAPSVKGARGTSVCHSIASDSAQTGEQQAIQKTPFTRHSLLQQRSLVFLNPELDIAAQCDFLWIW